MLFDGIGSLETEWAWIVFQLRVAEDRPEWFPKGKSATIQIIEKWLYDEAELRAKARSLARVKPVEKSK
jgi:hypoxanthine phosphoribosyltransferase